MAATGQGGSREQRRARRERSPPPSAADLLEAGLGMLVLRLAVRSWRAEGGGSLLGATRLTFTALRALCADMEFPDR